MEKTKKPDEQELINSLKEIYPIYPPDNDTNIIKAFRAIVPDRYPELIAYTTFCSIYKQGKALKQMAKEILKMSKKRVSVESFTTNIGKRGKGKEMNYLIEAEKILFNPKDIMKNFNVNIDKTKLYLYICFFYHYFYNNNITDKQLHSYCVQIGVTTEIMKLSLYCLDIYFLINKTVLSPINDSKKRNIFCEIYLKNTWPFNTKTISIKKPHKKHIDEFRRYLHSKNPSSSLSRDGAFYRTKKFKYLCFLYICFEKLLDTGRKFRQESLTKELKEKLKDLDKDEQRKLLKNLSNEFFPQGLNPLLPPQRLLLSQYFFGN